MMGLQNCECNLTRNCRIASLTRIQNVLGMAGTGLAGKSLVKTREWGNVDDVVQVALVNGLARSKMGSPSFITYSIL